MARAPLNLNSTFKNCSIDKSYQPSMSDVMHIYLKSLQVTSHFIELGKIKLMLRECQIKVNNFTEKYFNEKYRILLASTVEWHNFKRSYFVKRYRSKWARVNNTHSLRNFNEVMVLCPDLSCKGKEKRRTTEKNVKNNYFKSIKG